MPPQPMFKNIPYSLALRIVRICSIPEQRYLRLSELKQLLLQRDYKTKIIDAEIERARNISRTEALKRVIRNNSIDRPVQVVNYHKLFFFLNATAQKLNKCMSYYWPAAM